MVVGSVAKTLDIIACCLRTLSFLHGNFNVTAYGLLCETEMYVMLIKVCSSCTSLNKSAPGERERAQMTIFYGGQVIVFNDFSADKAKEVMHLAGKETSQSHPTHANDPVRSTISFPSHFTRNSTDSSNSIPPSPNVVPNFSNQAIQECIQPPSRPVVCGNLLCLITLVSMFRSAIKWFLIIVFFSVAELPIARKASLHRFLEKRKDR